MALTFRAAVAKFDELNMRKLIPNGTTGKLEAKSETRRNQIVSHVRTAIGAVLEGSSSAGVLPDAEDFDVEAYQFSLPAIAKQDARENLRHRPNDRESDVRTFCRAVFGTIYGASHRKKTSLEGNIPPAFHPLFASFFLQATGGSDGRAGYKSRAAQFCDVMTAAGFHSPEMLPSDWGVICLAFRAAKVPDDRRGNILLAYRLARTMSGLSHLPAMEAPPHAHERGLRTVPGIADLVARGAARRQRLEAERQAAGDTARSGPWAPPESIGNVQMMSTLDMIACLAPGQHDFLAPYLEWADTQGARVAGTTEDAIDALGCFTAELLRLGYVDEVFTCDLIELFTTRKTRPRKSPLTSATARKYAKDADSEQVSLFRIALEAAAKRSVKHSYKSLPLEVVHGDIPFVTEAVINHLARVRGIITHVAAVWDVPESEPDKWEAYKMELERLESMIATINEPVVHLLEGQKDKLLVPITWAQAMFVGVPRLWKKAHASRGKFFAALERHGNNYDASPVQSALWAYIADLKEWILVMLYLEDGMRSSNYAYARLNRAVIPNWSRDEAGRPLTIQSVLVRFTPGAQDGSRTKTTGAPRVRYLRAGLWDFELLADYVMWGRREELLKAGKVENREAYDPLTDQHAFLVNPRTGRTRMTKTARRSRKPKREWASYSPSHVSKTFGRLLHWMARDVLKQHDINGEEIPSWKQLRARTPEGKQLRMKWRALWNGHVARLLIGNYIGGYLELWREATERTHHTKDTMKASYMTHFRAVLDERRGWDGWENPEFFAELARKVLKDRASLDWRTFDPAKPGLAKLTLPGGGTDRAA